MRYLRQNKIIEIIENNDVDTQEKLASMLKDEGFEVTQATISRDIKELRLIKELTHYGSYRYSAPAIGEDDQIRKLSNIFKDITIT